MTNTRLTAGRTDLDDLVSDFAVIPTQKLGDLLDRETAYEHIAQLAQLRIRPFPPSVRSWGFVFNLGALWIDDEGADDPEECIPLGISWLAEELAYFYISVT